MSKPSRILPVLAVLLLWLTACAAKPAADDFAYANTAFTATVQGTYTPADGIPRPIAATVTLGAPTEGGIPRSLTVTFQAPDALAGVTVSATPSIGGDSLPRRITTFQAPSAYGTVTADDESGAFDGLLRYAEALLPVGDIVSVTPTAEDGTRVVTRRTADGGREGVYTFTEGSVLPTRVEVMTGGVRLELTVRG